MNHRVVLKDAFKGYTVDQDKIFTPEETVGNFKARLKEVDLDILAETVRIDNGRLDIPIFFSVCGRDARETIGTKKQMGKGGTPAQSEASAVMELAERFSFFSYCKNPENFFFQEYDRVKGPVLPYTAIAFSVHDDSAEAELARRVFARIPLQWTWAYNLTRDRAVLIPFNWFFMINEFNGPSAGNCVEEAVLQGVCEITERHVSSIVSRNRLRTPAIDLGSVTDPLVLELIGKYQRAGVRLFASDFSLDTGIPSVGVLAYDPATFPARSEIVWTAGTTPSPQKALSRGLTEVAQLAGDFNSSANYVASGLPKFNSLAEAEYVMKGAARVSLFDLPDLSHDNIRVEVENCLAALARINLDVILVNVTHPRLGIPAFYTIIPGAHFRERAAGTSVGMFTAKLIADGGDPRRAIAELEAMDALLPGKYYVQFFLGVSHLAAQEPRQALGFLEQALELEPKAQDVPSIYSYIGQCLKAMEDYRGALVALEKAQSHDSERTDVHNLMGYCYFKLREHQRAIECFRKVLELDPSSAIDYANIASNYRDLGDREKALRYYRFALELDPGLDWARQSLEKLERADSA